MSPPLRFLCCPKLGCRILPSAAGSYKAEKVPGRFPVWLGWTPAQQTHLLLSKRCILPSQCWEKRLDRFFQAQAQVTPFLQKQGNGFGDFWKHTLCFFFWKVRTFYSAVQMHSEKATKGLWAGAPNSSPKMTGRCWAQTRPHPSPEMDADLPQVLPGMELGWWGTGTQGGACKEAWVGSGHTASKKGQPGSRKQCDCHWTEHLENGYGGRY